MIRNQCNVTVFLGEQLAPAMLFPCRDLIVGHRPGLQPNCRITREQVRSRVLCVAFCHRCSSCKAVTHRLIQ